MIGLALWIALSIALAQDVGPSKHLDPTGTATPAVSTSAPITGPIAAATSEELAPSLFAQRRAALLEKLGADAIVVLCTAPVHPRNGDVDHPFRPNSDFWYLTGFPEPEGVAVLETRDGKPYCTLFVPEASPGSELWTGRRLGVKGAAPLADACVGMSQLERALAKLLVDRRNVFAQFGGDDKRRALVATALESGVAVDEDGLRDAIGRMRLVKSRDELALLQRAIDVTCAAELNAMSFAKPGMYEYEIQGVVEATYMLLGSPRLGFPSIVGAGRNSCILHYETNRELVPQQKTIVVDIGAEFGLYSADVTRTLPSSGKFTPEQATIYQCVLDAQNAGIAAAKSGATIGRVDHTARHALAEALTKAGVVKNSQDATSLCPHGICHWLGLEVHDDCPYGDDGGEVKLAPGMVTTVEPGCYVRAGATGVDPKYFEIGVRIEDDVLITESGNVVMSAGAPREIAAVEAAMAKKSLFPRLQ